MKVSKKLIALLVVLVAGFGFVACNNTTTTTDAPTTQPETTEAPADLTAALTALQTQYADTLGSASFLATENLTLVSEVAGATVTWVSGNTDYLANDGTVTQPTFTTGNQTVVLTATLSNGVDADVEQQFLVVIPALDKSDAERAAEVFLTVTAFPTKEFWNNADSESLEFLTTGKDKDDVSYDVVWTSSNATVISVAGEIDQPEDASVVVTMTATITINGVDFTKDVAFTVAKLADADEYATIAAMLTAAGADALDSDDDNNHYVSIPGATVIGIQTDNGIFITDGTDIILVYGTSFDVEVGDVYDVYGELTSYFSAYQLASTALHPVRFEASTETPDATPATTGATVASVIADQPGTPSASYPFSVSAYEITAKVFYNEEDGGNYSVYLVPVDYDFTAALTGSPKPNGSSIMIYYKSNIDLLKGLDEETVTLTISLIGYRTDKGVWYADFFGGLGDITTSFADDAATAQAALDTATIGIPMDVPASGSFEVYTNIFGATIAYASDNATLVDPVTGLIDASSLTNTRETVTLTVTATVGTEVKTEEIEIKVGELPISTISEAAALAEDTLVKVQGIIVMSSGNREYMIQDATGGIAIYEYNGDTQDLLAANLGKEVTLIGVLGGYSGLIQLKNIEGIAVVTEAPTMPAATNMDAIADWSTYQGTIVEGNGFVVTSISGTDTSQSIYVDLVRASDGLELTLELSKYSDVAAAKEAEITALTVGDVINVTSPLWWKNGARILVTNQTVIATGTALTEAEKVAFDAMMFDTEPVTLTGNYELPELLFSDVAVVISAGLTGATDDLATTDSILIVRQAAEETGTFVFTLTATGGTATQDVTVNVTIPAAVSYDVTETFTGSTLPTSYSDSTYTGVNSITWTFVESRNDDGYEIDGEGLLLRRSDEPSTLTSSVISGGISNFSIEMLKGYTGSGNRQIKVIITAGGVDHEYTSIAWDDTEVHVFEINDINVTGDFTITIENVTPKQVVIDNISWNGYVVE